MNIAHPLTSPTEASSHCEVSSLFSLEGQTCSRYRLGILTLLRMENVPTPFTKDVILAGILIIAGLYPIPGLE